MFLGDLHRHMVLLAAGWSSLSSWSLFRDVQMSSYHLLRGPWPFSSERRFTGQPIDLSQQIEQPSVQHIYISNPNSGKSGNLNVIASEAPVLHTAENTVKFNLLNPVPNRGQRPSCYHVQILSKVGEPRILEFRMPRQVYQLYIPPGIRSTCLSTHWRCKALRLDS